MLYRGFDQDREYLINKFRCPVFDPSTGRGSDDISAGIVAFAEQLEREKLPKPVIKARCFEHICRNLMIDVNPHDCFPGFGSYNRKKRPVLPLLNKWNREIDDRDNHENDQEIILRNASGAQTVWKDFDHSIPDWDALISLGFAGLRERAKKYRAIHEGNGTLTPEVQAHFEAMDITVNAVLETLRRLIDYAGQHHSGNERIKAEISALEQLVSGPPRNFYEVLMLIYIHFYFGEQIDHMQVRSIGGNLDVRLYPFYKNDLESGTFTVEKMREFLTCFLMQWDSIDNYWGHPFYLGGTGENGESLYNEVSYLILEVFRELAIPTPKIQLKIAKNTPEKLLDTALSMVRDHHSSLTFVSESGIRHALTRLGFSDEEARTCNITGCYESAPKTASNVTGASYLNLLKCIEFVFYDGTDPRTGYRMDCRAKSLDEIGSFDEFYLAFLKYLDANIECIVRNTFENEKYLHEINPSPLYSLTILNSLVTGLDGFAKGNVHNLSTIQFTGLGTAVDALMAVKKYVFDWKILSLKEFRGILKDNWAGAGTLRRKILRDKFKYGNGIPEVDRYAAEIVGFIGKRVNRRPNSRNGFFIASGHCARTFITLGNLTGATPDGRLAGEEISKNLSPTMGADSNGITALIRSVTTIDSADLPGDFPLDAMLHPTSVQGQDGLDAMKRLLATYISLNGIVIQFNIFNAEELREAQRDPQKYANLQIRVCGWNVRFVELAKPEQDAYIKRAENIME